MQPSRRTRIAALVILAVLAWSPGVLYAECAAACPFGETVAAHRCCLPQGAEPAMRAASCCETVRAAAPVETSRAVRPPASAPFVLAAPLTLPSEPLSGPRLAEPPLSPPPLHEGVGLYTLHAAFLI